MNRFNQQTGITAVGMVIVLALIAFFSILAIKIFPVFLESFKVNTALKSLKDESGVAAKSSTQIKQLLINRLNIDDVDNVERENINLIKSARSVKVVVEYNVEKNLVANIFLLVKFNKEVEINN